MVYILNLHQQPAGHRQHLDAVLGREKLLGDWGWWELLVGRGHCGRMWQASLRGNQISLMLFTEQLSSKQFPMETNIITLFSGNLLDPLANFKYIWEDSRCFEDKVYVFIGNWQLGTTAGKAAVLAQQLSVCLGHLGNQCAHSWYMKRAGNPVWEGRNGMGYWHIAAMGLSLP